MIDLHTHSNLSDGSSEPEQIAELAARAGCSYFALTDHDRLDGIERASRRAGELGITCIAGCEVSCDFLGTSCHVLVYFVQPGQSPLQDELDRLLDDRETRNGRLIGRLNQLGVDITLEEVRAQAGQGSIGRPHFAQVLVDKGLVGSIQDAFDEYLGKGSKAYVGKARVTPGEVAKLARLSGGVAVLAHPFTLGLEGSALKDAVLDLRDQGLVGLEAYYGRYSRDQRDLLVSLANSLDMVPTGGSDFHGDYKPDLAVGVGTGDLFVPDDVLDSLQERCP